MIFRGELWPLQLSIFAVLVAAVTLALSFAWSGAAWAGEDATTLHVSAVTGVDSATCGSQAAPCKSIQKAINRSQSGDTIKVAAGTYGYPGSDNPCYQFFGQMLVVACLIDKQITLQGGYSTADWSTYAPTVNVTVIDGEGRTRGVYVASSNPGQPARSNVMLSGFTVRNGLHQGANTGSDLVVFAFGGGMLADASYLELHDLVFESNIARGGSTSSNVGGAASGGGLALRAMAGTVNLSHVVFRNNRAQGGQGPIRGGIATGGGLYTFQTTIAGSDLQFIGNVAQAGDSMGSGKDAMGETADGTGGGATFQVGSNVNLDQILAYDNQAIGGAAAQYAGGGFGGALKFEGYPVQANFVTMVRIGHARVYNNLALGANGAFGGIAQGGGMEGLQATVTIEESHVYANQSTGGDGTQLQGPAGGGGITFGNIVNADSSATIVESIITDNEVRSGSGPVAGGGGGGIWLQGIRTTLVHNTIAGNKLLTAPLQGTGILILNDGSVGTSIVDIRYNLIANHNDAVAGNAALHVKTGNTANLAANVFAHNNMDVNVSQVGTINGMGTSVIAADAVFLSPGAPDYDYNISFASPAVNAAVGSADTADIDGDSRQGVPDAGAQEAAPFTVFVAPQDSSLSVQWGNNLGVLSYQLGVTCPIGASAPNELACGATRSYEGNTAGTLLTGLTNYERYGVTVLPMLPGNIHLTPTEVVAAPTDKLVYIPVLLDR